MNGDSLLDNFCEGEPIWDYNLAWNTTSPRFTHCFQKTIPIWIPSLFLWLFAPLEAYLTLRTDCSATGPFRPIPYNRYNVSRLVTVALIVLVNGVQFGYDMKYFLLPDAVHHVNMADLTSSLLNVFTFILFGFLVYLHRKHGQHTSGLAWLFTFLVLIFSLPIVYMYAFFYGDENVLTDPARTGFKQWSLVDFTIFSVHFGLILVLFLLTCFADIRPPIRRRKSLKVDADAFNINGSCKELEESLELKNVVQNGEAKPLVEKIVSEEDQADARLKECPELEASFLSQLSYWWFNSLAITGFKKSLTMEDLWRLNPEYMTNHIAPIFDQAWLKQIKFSRTTPAETSQTTESAPEVEFVQSGKKPGVITALSGVFGWYFLAGAIFKMTHDMLQFVNPMLLKVFIGFVGEPVFIEPIWHGFIIACGFFFVSTIQSVMINVYFHFMYSIGMRVRSALISAIYRKSLNLSNGARRDTTTGEIVNLMSVDAQRFVDLLPFINLIWSAPLQIIITIYFLWNELGPSVLAGLFVMVLMIPLNGWISTYQRRLQIKQMKKKDERVKVINEILGGIKVLKLYAWEIPFIAKVNAIRDVEISMLKNISYMGAVTSFIWTTAPFLVSFVSFALYVLIDDQNILNAKKAFVSLALFNLLRFPLTMLPQMITSMVMASVSVKRLNKFLNSGQLNAYVTRDDAADAITIEGGVFAWEGASEKKEESKESKESSEVTEKPTEDTDDVEKSLLNGNADQNGNAGVKNGCTNGTKTITLNGIDLKVPKGSLVAIVGHVGSGKSSLLSAILGDMERIDGKVNVAKGQSVAYVSQQAWIRNATLRENILFGADFVKARYDSIIEMCALKPDLAILPGGDQTEIGEKGINLSGGQKQRVAIARACYQPASIVLLDDPLSAVDSHVAKHIFQKVLSTTTGYLRDRTRVLVTNSIQLLPEVDNIIVMSSGQISEIGTYDQLLTNNGKFADFVREHSSEKRNEENLDLTDPEASILRRNASVSSESKSTPMARQKSVKEEQKLIEAERAETGNVKWSVYLNYFRSLTFLWLSVMFIGFIAMQALSVASSVWLAVWANDNSGDVFEKDMATRNEGNATFVLTDEERSLRNMRLTIYGILGALQAVFVFVGAVAMAKGTVNSSGTMHRSLLYRIMRSPMEFFDTTPLGRILNRFGKDIDTLDSTIPHTIRGWLLCFLQVLSTFILIGFEVPVFILVALPILVIYYFIQKFYVATSRQLKRLESVTRSPIYSHFGETLNGVHTIRAYDATKRFIADSNHIVDTNQRCNYSSVIANRWLALRLEFCGNLIVFFSAVFAVLSRESFQAEPGFIGLIMTYSLSVTQTLNWLVRMTSEMETNVVSVERIGEYCENETEKEWTRIVNAEPAIPEKWPMKGEIKFEQYAVRYRAGLGLVLNGISLNVQPGEKVGIVGRTGAGKSSLTLALFRILEGAGGSIVIDGIDIGKIGLHELRSKLSIIPQDPVLFSGTIRTNLDPFGIYSDDLLWQALEHAHLKEYIASMDAGLDYTVAENGENLSVGQRQLICLARALLRKTRILVLDEATAAIDLETDSLIQETIRREFAECTVLTIAHRLNTIMDSTRVLVLDKGTVAEFDSPENLLADRRSRFFALAKDARLV